MEEGFTSSLSLFLFFVLGGAGKYFMLASLRRKRRDCSEYVGSLSKVTLFPLKSGRGVNLQEARCTHRGLANAKGLLDRTWMVVNANGDFVTGRRYPRLTLVQTLFHGDDIQLTAPGMAPLTLPSQPSSAGGAIVEANIWGLSAQGLDCGHEASNWISKYLNQADLRLIFCAPSLRKRKVSQCDETHWHAAATDKDEVSFQDGFPYMLTSEASLRDLTGKLGNSSSVRMDNFRPNLVATGCDAFDEDNWDVVQIGQVIFRNSKPCTRCIFTTVNPDSGERDKNMEPLKTLRKYRVLLKEFEHDPCFGTNMLVEKPGVVKVGDPIYVTRK